MDTDAAELLSVPVLGAVVAGPVAGSRTPQSTAHAVTAAVSYPCGLQHTVSDLGELVMSDAVVPLHWARRFAPAACLAAVLVLTLAAVIVFAGGGEDATDGWLFVGAAACASLAAVLLCLVPSASVTRIQAPNIPSARDPHRRAIFTGRRSHLTRLAEWACSGSCEGLKHRTVDQVRSVTLRIALRPDGQFATEIGLTFDTEADEHGQQNEVVPAFEGATEVPHGEAERWRIFLRPDNPAVLHETLQDVETAGGESTVVVVAWSHVVSLTMLGLLLAIVFAAATGFRWVSMGFRFGGALSVALAVGCPVSLLVPLVGGVCLPFVHVTRIGPEGMGVVDPRRRALLFCRTSAFALWRNRLEFTETTVGAVRHVVVKPRRVHLCLRGGGDGLGPLVFEGRNRRYLHRVAARWQSLLECDESPV